jgi:hypothetical protein
VSTDGDVLRALVAALPEAAEVETWGHPTFRVRGKMFATMDVVGTQASVKATLEDQAALVAEDPGTYAIPSYVGRHGWVSVRLAGVCREELRELLTDAWRATAPRRLVRTVYPD